MSKCPFKWVRFKRTSKIDFETLEGSFKTCAELFLSKHYLGDLVSNFREKICIVIIRFHCTCSATHHRSIAHQGRRNWGQWSNPPIPIRFWQEFSLKRCYITKVENSYDVNKPKYCSMRNWSSFFPFMILLQTSVCIRYSWAWIECFVTFKFPF